MVDIREFLRLTLDPVRLAVLGRAVEGPVDAAETASRLGVPERTVRVALGRLRGSGLIGSDRRIDHEVLRRLATELPQPLPVDPAVVGEGWTADEAEVLTRFFSGSRLTSIPGAHGKRLVVLERLAQEFQPGVRYDEPEVNFRLQLFHPDYASLRRHLVDEGLMTRADGVYWRTGGRYQAPTDDPGEAGTVSG